MKRSQKISLISLLIIVIIALVGLFTIRQLTYSPSKAAQEAVSSSKTVTVKETSDAIIFEPKANSKKMAVIFYQGAFVEEASYSIWAKSLAEAGYPTYLVHQPFNLAVLAGNKAESILSDYDIHSYVIGGHSLGGVMASRFASQQAAQSSRDIKGVFFLASYPDEKGSLADSKLPVLSITASKDAILNWENYEASKKALPNQTQFEVIKGGNHGGFGSYGQQKGDSAASLSNQEQQKLISQDLIAWLNKVQ